MRISINPGSLQEWHGAVLIVGLLEENLEKQLIDLDKRFEGNISKGLIRQKFKAKESQVAIFELLSGEPSKLIFIGMGEKQNISLENLHHFAAVGARKSLGSPGRVGIKIPEIPLDLAIAAKAIGEAFRLATFKDQRFRGENDPLIVTDDLELIGLPKSAEKFIEEINPICSGVELARELVGAPPNNLTPNKLASIAADISKEYALEVKILNQKECQARNMGAFLAVAQGSDLEPKFIHLIYKGKGPLRKKVALVGKGLTFDSGGYNLKVGAAQIDLMKFDMGGSAAVIGAARAIAELSPEGIEAHFIVATCENMINGSAVHPGDIIRASNGKTIEINNTDAEGRLTLADALVYACALKPDEIVDLATLTGACVIALGNEMAGLWTESDKLATSLRQAAEQAGEGLWRMPMRNSYKEGLKSMLADLKNTGPRPGGSITAALFLKEFVDQSIPWAHIDIAGPVWAEKERGLDPAGATGYGVRTLINWVTKQT